MEHKKNIGNGGQMANTIDFNAILENPDFNLLVTQLITVVDRSQQQGISANVACDALQYVNALMHEASPVNEGPKGLRAAHKQISDDAKAMLTFARDLSLRQGKPLLLSMTEAPTVS